MRSLRPLIVTVCSAVIAVMILSITGPGVSRARAQVAEGAASGPSTREADVLPVHSSIREQFEKLADPDPRVRDQARFDLMGMSGTDLPKFRQLVADAKSLRPDQVVAIKEIVIQVFLAAERYTVAGGIESGPEGTEGPFFMGVTWPMDVENEELRLGASIDERLPGFPSYRFLKRGDMILGVFKDPTAPVQQLPNMEVHSRDALKNAIMNPPQIQDITLEVLRDGEVLRIAMKMAPKPIDADSLAPGAIKAFNAARIERANTYWRENFAPLLPDYTISN